ncbi:MULTISPECIES: esterase-like activity of phytase family protein [unclassified Nostoc]|uniref:esterase-like activity of phytase family protein n=1 Tax=unclassified Nostoc TaxID=2593658 RepID=UPI0025AAB4DF|nr:MULTISPECIES: esterase-like activity of phytase family protein [unclassified Nostoc]MDM9581351.1 esterase-like activity of phytase family protein [Nostoc sp. GT001]MDZ7948966.1 esterase-like activity of phytase family protein [Nostoc sp. EfeVER01]MDZ7992478.1 esterase-like activity of phytase family protein [Nostoc sp. EspVER01]
MQIIKKIFVFPKILYILILIVIISFIFANLPSNGVEVSSIEFIGEANLPKSLIFQNTEVGGLSGITYNPKNNLYYAISDDRGQKAAARFYTLKIDFSKGSLQKGGIIPVSVTTLLNENGQTFRPSETDTEGIALTNKATVFVSSEGDAAKLINPFIKEFSLSSGREIATLPIPNKFLPDKASQQGIRNNLAFESLTITPDNKHLFTATENALIQDGVAAKPNIGSPCRILQYNLLNNQSEKEFLYQTEPVAPFLNLIGKFASGLPDLLALDNQGHFLSLERSFTGLGFAISLFQISLEEADDIHNIDSLLAVDSKNIKPVKKKLLLDLRKLDVLLDNIEGLTLGPKLPDGQQSLIIISDNNFNSLQRTQILAFKIKIENPLIRLLRRFIPNFNL